MSKPTPAPTPPPDAPITRATINTRRDALVAARDQLRLQLNGVENQIYILDQLLNPDPTPAETESPTPLPPGTI
jgi:hypothetical protein